MKTCVFGLALLVLGTLLHAAPQLPGDSQALRIGRAIDALGSPDPAERAAAVKQLVELGAVARPAVVEAARGDDPETRAKAAQVLLLLPWYSPDDPPEVRKILGDYGKLDPQKRKEAIAALLDLDDAAGPSLARLIIEEPSHDVKWTIVAGVRTAFGKVLLERFCRLDTQGDVSAPLLAAAGHAWMTRDAVRGLRLLRRAIELEASRPSDDLGEFHVACQRIAAMALLADRPEEAADLLRRRIARGAAEDEESSTPLLDLFALHARLGPLAGFEQDLQRYHNALDDPRIAYCLAKLQQRQGDALLASAALQGAFLRSADSVERRLRTGDFLFRQGWIQLAGREWQAVFQMAGENPELDRANAHFRLSQMAAAQEDSAQAVRHMRLAMDLHQRGQGQLRGSTEDAIWHEIRWHELRIARDKGDALELARLADTLLARPPANPDIVVDLVAVLEQQKRQVEADELFNRAYAELKQELDQKPDYPQNANNMAWLCARAGRHAQEALDLAQRATRLAPDNAAFMDTLAEALFHLGRFEEAVRVEQNVLKVRWGDVFLQRQLARFEAAARSSD